MARTGERSGIALSNAAARTLAAKWAAEYGVGDSRTVKFGKELAKADLADKDATKGKGKTKKAG